MPRCQLQMPRTTYRLKIGRVLTLGCLILGFASTEVLAEDKKGADAAAAAALAEVLKSASKPPAKKDKGKSKDKAKEQPVGDYPGKSAVRSLRKKRSKPKRAVKKKRPKEERRLIKAVKKFPKNLDTHFDLGRYYYDTYQIDECISTLRPVSDKMHRSGLMILARCYLDRKDPLEAVRVADLLLSKNPNDYRAMVFMGRSYSRMAERSQRAKDERRYSGQALDYLRLAVKKNKKYLPAYQAIYEEYKRLDNLYEMRQVLNDMTKFFGARTQFLNNLCEVNYLDGFHDAAKNHCKLAITKNPGHADNHVYLGLIYYDLDQLPTAKRIIFKAARQFKDSELVQWSAGKISGEQNNFVASYRYYSKAVDADDESARAQLGLARSAFKLQKYKIAKDAYLKACQLNRKYSIEFKKAAGELRVGGDMKNYDAYMNTSAKCFQ